MSPLLPNYAWAQRKDKIFLTIDIQDATGEKVYAQEDGKVYFKGTDGKEKNTYELDITLLKELDVENSKWSVMPRGVRFSLAKKESGPHWERLLKEGGKHHNQKIDWAHYVDEDEEDEAGAPEFGMDEGFDMSKMNFNEGDSDDDSDDDLPDLEEDEDEKK
eukprot:GFYU01003330.1.p2 GENE.GFYU01003330.1~~GFYU01003330.1.p2  ORF type:complete len:161 (+),score=68.04 GFYU01003330.1:36-518(+)